MSNPGEELILVLNSGSSSLKAGLFLHDEAQPVGCERAVLVAEASGIGKVGGKLSVRDAEGKELASNDHALNSQPDALTAIADQLRKHKPQFKPVGIGHRIVHGGASLREHTCLTPTVLNALKASVHYAPLHLPGSIELIEQSQELYPGVEQAACFDTAFHQTMPAVAKRLAIPERFAEDGVRRYGFHGLSYESLVAQLRAEPHPVPGRIVLAHLGSGSSLCAVLHGESIDTTMGMTPCGGIPMATRTGDLDPGVLLFLGRTYGLSFEELERMVNHESGLAAVAQGSGNLQDIQKTMSDPAADRRSRSNAELAFALFATSIAKQVASLTVSLGGLDLLVFAGGIGEHSAPLRAAVLEQLAPFGLTFSRTANEENAAFLHEEDSKVPIRILPAEEDPVIAGHTRRLIGQAECKALS